MSPLEIGLFILTVLFTNSLGGKVMTYDAILEQISFVNTSYWPNTVNITICRIRKFNRTLSVLNFEIDILRDMDDTYSMQVDIHFRRSSGNHYEKTPFHVAKQSLPDYNKKYYAPLIMDSLRKCSNFPQFGPDEKDYKYSKVRKRIFPENFLKQFLDAIFRDSIG